MRIWELENMVSTSTSTPYPKYFSPSRNVLIRPEKGADGVQDLKSVSGAMRDRGTGLGLASKEINNELASSRGWIGFDDEQVVVLRERDRGKQMLAIYDFI